MTLTDPTVLSRLATEARDAEYSDTERLTWLITNWASFGSTASMIDGRWDDRIFVRRECEHGYEWHCTGGVDPRAAIDAAINAPRCAPHDVTGCVNASGWHDEVENSPMALMRRRVDSLVRMLRIAKSDLARARAEAEAGRADSRKNR